MSWGKGRSMQPGPAKTPAGVREGDVLAGKYLIERVLGAGGMGIVVAAHHVQLDEKVAIKFLLPEALTNQVAVARFAREARAAVKIKSEHVVRVIDVGTLDTGAPYMVMEYLEGGDLAAWLRQQGPLSVEQAVEFVLQASEAIADAHAMGIVHRDLKPANLFCVRRSDGLLSIKVLDFGISKFAVSAATAPNFAMTDTSMMMGSPLYMSPEQMHSSRDVDARTDIWAVGVILYELLTGKPPFTGESLPEVCTKASSHPPPPLAEYRPELPAELEAVILKCLAKDREQRYRNIAELAAALAPFGPKRARALVERISRIIQAAGLSQSALALPPSSDPSQPSSTPEGTFAAWGQTGVAKKWGRPSALIAAGIVGVGVVALLIGPHKGTASNSAVGSIQPATSIYRAEPTALPIASPASVPTSPVPSASRTAPNDERPEVVPAAKRDSEAPATSARATLNATSRPKQIPSRTNTGRASAPLPAASSAPKVTQSAIPTASMAPSKPKSSVGLGGRI